MHVFLAAVIINLGENGVAGKIFIWKTCIKEPFRILYNEIGCDMIYEMDRDINRKIRTFQAMYGTVCRMLKERT
jgi:hypothetical protein